MRRVATLIGLEYAEVAEWSASARLRVRPIGSGVQGEPSPLARCARVERTGWRRYSLFLGEDGMLGLRETDDSTGAGRHGRHRRNARGSERAEFLELDRRRAPDTGLRRLRRYPPCLMERVEAMISERRGSRRGGSLAAAARLGWCSASPTARCRAGGVHWNRPAPVHRSARRRGRVEGCAGRIARGRGIRAARRGRASLGLPFQPRRAHRRHGRAGIRSGVGGRDVAVTGIQTMPINTVPLSTRRSRARRRRRGSRCPRLSRLAPESWQRYSAARTRACSTSARPMGARCIERRGFRRRLRPRRRSGRAGACARPTRDRDRARLLRRGPDTATRRGAP